jgi:hypothetical protein
MDLTITNNRNSESKNTVKKSVPKTRKINDKYRFCSPKLDMKYKEFEETLEMKSIRLLNRTHLNKDSKQNTTTLESSEEDDLKDVEIEIEDLLGSGTFGKVFSARVKNSNKMIALKRVQQDKKYKTREMDIVKMLDSPFIIKILGTFVTDEGKYEYLNIAM